MTRNLVKKAAPANVSTRDRSIGAFNGSRISERHDQTKHRVRRFAGAACLTPYLAFSLWTECHGTFGHDPKRLPSGAIGHSTLSGDSNC